MWHYLIRQIFHYERYELSAGIEAVSTNLIVGAKPIFPKLKHFRSSETEADMSENCTGGQRGTISSQDLAAIGQQTYFYYGYHPRHSYWATKYTAMAPESWLNTNHQYEINSVMHYDSELRQIRQTYPKWPYKVMTYKDNGWKFEGGEVMTTTDSLQVDEMYCEQMPQYKSKAGF